MNDNKLETPKKKNSLGIILLILGFTLIAAGLGYQFFMPEQNLVSNNDSSDNSSYDKDDNNDDNENSTEYNGILSFEASKQITDVFNITVPDEFIATFENNNSIDKSLETDGKGVFNDCSVELKEIINFNNAESLATSMMKYHGVETELVTTEINNITWYNFQYESLGINDIYLTQKDKHVYIFTYQIESDANQEICQQYMPALINSISYK